MLHNHENQLSIVHTINALISKKIILTKRSYVYAHTQNVATLVIIIFKIEKTRKLLHKPAERPLLG